MAQEIKVILDLSDKAQTFLEEQHIDLYEELQQAVPSLQLRLEPDPDAPQGTRDLTTVILAVATLVSSLTPLIIRILNQYTPPNRSIHWEIEETEVHHPDSSITIQRKHIGTGDEQRPWADQPSPNNPATEKPSLPENTSSKEQ